MKIVIVDYGMGNIKSLSGALAFLEAKDVSVSNQHSDILSADKLILPGVGSFSKAMVNIKNLKLDECLKQAITIKKTPILGICLGMQLMCESSQEDGTTDGLGFISGKVEQFTNQNIKIPHVGFNQVKFEDSSLYQGIANMSDFYFTHSYKMMSQVNNKLAFCEYGSEFIASYEKENIVGVQFHPELSQTNGLKLMANFLKNF